MAHELMPPGRFDDVDIGVLITQITDELPSPKTSSGCGSRLAAKGWPLDDAPRRRGTPDSRPAGIRRRAGLARRARCWPPWTTSCTAAASALVPVPDGDDRSALAALRVGEAIDDDVALVVTTSGTTGTPKGALLTAAALTASAAATHDRLGGPGRWLLALPPYHIAGVQVLVRSLLAGTAPGRAGRVDGLRVSRIARCRQPTRLGPPLHVAGRRATGQGARPIRRPPPRWPSWTPC